MNRRRLFYLCTTLFLIGAVIAAWFLFAQRDADFHVIGPRTRSVRANLAMLDSKIDVADFQDCKTLRETLSRLGQTLRKRMLEADPGPNIGFGHHVQLETDAFDQDAGIKNLAESSVQFSSKSQLLTAKQFLRDAFQQTGVKDAHFIVRSYWIEATTLDRVQQERTRYLDSVSLFDRVHNAWKELTGQVEDDIIEVEVTQWDVK